MEHAHELIGKLEALGIQPSPDNGDDEDADSWEDADESEDDDEDVEMS